MKVELELEWKAVGLALALALLLSCGGCAATAPRVNLEKEYDGWLLKPYPVNQENADR